MKRYTGTAAWCCWNLAYLFGRLITWVIFVLLDWPNAKDPPPKRGA
jgi:hypothetical protein